jgi:CubicO group peptidase (beta-lactamase class C family)
MAADPLPSPQGVADQVGDVRSLYDGTLPPEIQAHTLRHVDRLFPTRTVAKGPQPLPLEPSPLPWPDIRFRSAGRGYDLADFLALNRVGGLLVIQNTRVRLEHYGLGGTAHDCWTSMSMAKSISTTLMGAALHEGLIRSLDEAVTRYVPQLSGSAYDDVSLRHLLTMTSGVRWNETYADPASDRRRMLDAQIRQQPGAILALMAGLPRAHAPGTRFNYSTGETHVVGAVLRQAVGAPVAHYLSQRIWAPFGMEADATWWLESPDGLEVAGSGLSARLRDFARFGLFMLAGGMAGGRQVLPEDWGPAATRDQLPSGHDLPYGYMWWPLPDTAGPEHQGAFRAIGIFGQQLYIHPRDQLVIAQFSALPRATGSWSVAPEDLYGAIVRALRE